MRVQGITIPDEKRLEIGLTAVFGIGRSRAHKILEEVKVDAGKKAKDLSTEEEGKLREAIEKFTIEGDLRRDTSSHIKRLRDIGSYRGKRHSVSLPTRGQRTKTNSRTRRGNVRKTMGTGRRAVDKK
jgi:small subunit ribosomal protein S13